MKAFLALSSVVFTLSLIFSCSNVSKDSAVSMSREEIYHEGLISLRSWDENVFNFTQDGNTMFFTRGKDWIYQQGFIAKKAAGIYAEPYPIPALDSIYNGAISPDGQQIMYSVREGKDEGIWIVEDVNNKWTNAVNLTETSGVKGGYFHWINDSVLYFYTNWNNGDLVKGKLIDNYLSITDSLNALNTADGTEFSVFSPLEEDYLIFTRYVEGDTTQQGFFISYKQEINGWTKPQKIEELPYGWGGKIVAGKLFMYTDGEDIYKVPLEALKLNLTND